MLIGAGYLPIVDTLAHIMAAVKVPLSVLIARAPAQEARLSLMDESIAGLDFGKQAQGETLAHVP